MLRANEQGVEQPTVLNNFIDFLFIFGHFVSTTFLRLGIMLNAIYRLVKIWRRTRMRTKMLWAKTRKDKRKLTGSLLKERMMTSRPSGRRS